MLKLPLALPNGKVTILATQMTWVIGNLEDCQPIQIFSSLIHTPAPVTGFISRRHGTDDECTSLEEDDLSEVEGTVPRTLEAWSRAQKMDAEFDELLKSVDDAALKDELWLQALPGRTPTIIVPASCQELLVLDAHTRMQHLTMLRFLLC
jgi:hypothetical protein